MENTKKSNSEEPKKGLKNTFKKVPIETYNAAIQMLMNVNCKLGDGLKVLTGLQKSEIIEE